MSLYIKKELAKLRSCEVKKIKIMSIFLENMSTFLGKTNDLVEK